MPDYVEIPLTKGKFAKVDIEDAARVLPYRWCATRGGKSYYAVRGITQAVGVYTTLSMHRFLVNAPEGVEVDHENGDGLDNRRLNLRLATPTQQRENQTRIADTKTSRYKGVHFASARGSWVAKLKTQGKTIWLGYFATEEAAARAYDSAASRLFGEFASLNFDPHKR